jgi:hypothetical protein
LHNTSNTASIRNHVQRKHPIQLRKFEKFVDEMTKIESEQDDGRPRKLSKTLSSPSSAGTPSALRM